MTPDGIPYIGRFAASTPNWYVATGFGKWGHDKLHGLGASDFRSYLRRRKPARRRV